MRAGPLSSDCFDAWCGMLASPWSTCKKGFLLHVLYAPRPGTQPLRLVLGMPLSNIRAGALAAWRDAPPRRGGAAALCTLLQMGMYGPQQRQARRAPPAKSFGYDIYGVHAERPQAAMSFGARHAVAEATL